MVKKVSERKVRQQARMQQAENSLNEGEQAPAGKRPSPIWMILTGAMALVIIASLIYSSMDTWALMSMMASCGLFGASISTYRLRGGFLGFAIGSTVGFLIYLLFIFSITSVMSGAQ